MLITICPQATLATVQPPGVYKALYAVHMGKNRLFLFQTQRGEETPAPFCQCHVSLQTSLQEIPNLQE